LSKLTKKKKFSERRDEILSTTIHTLANDGYRSVSMRGIADRVGVHLSTIQYYFPTKRDLLKSTIEKSIGSMVRMMDDMILNSTLAPGKILQKALKIHIEACHDPMIARLFVELWSMASHDEDTNRLLSELYQHDCQRYAALIQSVNPGLSKRNCEKRAVLILAQLEGLVLFISPGKPFESSARVIEKQLWEQIHTLTNVPS
jgi:AcrR family transcriptional regulator